MVSDGDDPRHIHIQPRILWLHRIPDIDGDKENTPKQSQQNEAENSRLPTMQQGNAHCREQGDTMTIVEVGVTLKAHYARIYLPRSRLAKTWAREFSEGTCPECGATDEPHVWHCIAEPCPQCLLPIQDCNCEVMEIFDIE